MVRFQNGGWGDHSSFRDTPHGPKASTTGMESEHYRNGKRALPEWCAFLRSPEYPLHKLSFRDRYRNGALSSAGDHPRDPAWTKSEHYRNEKRALPECHVIAHRKRQTDRLRNIRGIEELGTYRSPEWGRGARRRYSSGVDFFMSSIRDVS